MEGGTPQFVSDFLALWDEAEIEAQVLDLEIGSDRDQADLAAFQQALQAIDGLKISGRYDQEIAKLRGNRTESEARHHTGTARDFARAYANLMAGVRSPDPEQRARFKKLMDELSLWEKVPSDVPKSILAVLEAAKRPKGRKSLIVPWANEHQHMDAMRLAVAAGQSVLDAARARAALEQTAGQTERAKTLAKLYRQKMDLRNK
ncbi:MAG: hypothetical protein O3A97_08680 [Proteobacteria bacterium]|nr:hypothetical protein [Pseudomonadota bacterium]